MILTKLQEALAEVDEQRLALDQVETQLRSMIYKLSGTPDIAPLNPPVTSRPSRHSMTTRDGLDDIVDVLRAEGKPLHITVIAERLSTMRLIKVSRTTFEPGLNRHITKTKVPRIAKFAPSTYGLPEWKQEPRFAKTA
jgi:hypothetical protein